jgi:hypothetical protein
MANQSPPPLLAGPIKVPKNFPITPKAGKITLLYDANSRELYHRLSPYGSDSFFGIQTRQPFLYRYPDDKLNAMQKNVSREFPFSRATDDVVRVTKFLTSGQGILWLGKQFLLQTGNAFNETRVYNPISPILAAAMPLTLWAFRPQRNIDLGSAGSVIGSFLGSNVVSIFTTRTTPPPGTIAGALPTINPDGGKGLIRAGTANAATTVLQSKWNGTSSGAGLGLGGFLSNTIKGLFGNFIPKTQEGITARSDEGTYGLMLGSWSGNNGPFSYTGASRQIDGVQQFWFGGSKGGSRKNGQIPLNWVKIYTDVDGSPILIKPNVTFQIDGLTGTVGYVVGDTDAANKYGDNVGLSKDQDFQGSNILIQHSMYVDDSKNYPSKLTDKTNDPSAVVIQRSLDKVLDNIRANGVYAVKKTDSSILPSSAQAIVGYNRISAMKKHADSETAYKFSALNEYRSNDIRVLENQHTSNPAKLSLKMASSRQFDGLNTLTVLDGDKKIKNSQIANWTEWSPYNDDLIALYFYDVVNDKYIPFRATPRGVQETVSVNWEELSFIGRADKVYSYGGFNRSLSFTFTVQIGSLIELSPTWQRINYLISLTKPANYTRRNTTNDSSNLYTRYIVPPMVMITLGDMYKNQPVAISSIGVAIPDTATWETQNAVNMPNGWQYLVNYITSPSTGKLYAQVPKTIDISVNCNVLEKERAIAGAAHFGHAPHDETYTDGVYRPTAPDFSSNPSEFDKNLVVYNSSKANKTFIGDANINPNAANTA